MQIHTKIAVGVVAGLGMLAAAGGAIAGKHGERGEHHGRDGRGAAMFQMFDQNNDGQITKDEINAYKDAQFAKFDVDANGELNEAEYIALVEDYRRQMLAKRFQKRDTDGNGGISKDEFASRMDRMFMHMDDDDDGVIKMEDMHKGKRGHHGHHRERDDD